MPVYTYRGTNRAGTAVSGEMTATSKVELQNLLKRQQITATKMSEKGREFNIPTFGSGVKPRELAIFTRQFSVMIDAGLPLVQCLEILASQQENKTFQKVLTNTRASVEGGSTLSAAMKQSPKVFDPLYTNMVEAGETGGILDTILQRLSGYIEKNVKLQRAVKSALVYPVGVLSVAALVIILLLWKVVPIFATLFAGLGVSLPLPTRIVITLSNLIGSWFGLIFLVGFVGIIFALRAWYGTPGGKLAMDAIVLKLPVIGILMRKIAVARFTRTLGTLISSGVPILEGLDITAKTAGNAMGLQDGVLEHRRGFRSEECGGHVALRAIWSADSVRTQLGIEDRSMSYFQLALEVRPDAGQRERARMGRVRPFIVVGGVTTAAPLGCVV